MNSSHESILSALVAHVDVDQIVVTNGEGDPAHFADLLLHLIPKADGLGIPVNLRVYTTTVLQPASLDSLLLAATAMHFNTSSDLPDRYRSLQSMSHNEQRIFAGNFRRLLVNVRPIPNAENDFVNGFIAVCKQMPSSTEILACFSDPFLAPVRPTNPCPHLASPLSKVRNILTNGEYCDTGLLIATLERFVHPALAAASGAFAAGPTRVLQPKFVVVIDVSLSNLGATTTPLHKFEEGLVRIRETGNRPWSAYDEFTFLCFVNANHEIVIAINVQDKVVSLRDTLPRTDGLQGLVGYAFAALSALRSLFLRGGVAVPPVSDFRLEIFDLPQQTDCDCVIFSCFITLLTILDLDTKIVADLLQSAGLVNKSHLWPLEFTDKMLVDINAAAGGMQVPYQSGDPWRNGNTFTADFSGMLRRLFGVLIVNLQAATPFSPPVPDSVSNAIRAVSGILHPHRRPGNMFQEGADTARGASLLPFPSLLPEPGSASLIGTAAAKNCPHSAEEAAACNLYCLPVVSYTGSDPTSSNPTAPVISSNGTLANHTSQMIPSDGVDMGVSSIPINSPFLLPGNDGATSALSPLLLDSDAQWACMPGTTGFPSKPPAPLLGSSSPSSSSAADAAATAAASSSGGMSARGGSGSGSLARTGVIARAHSRAATPAAAAPRAFAGGFRAPSVVNSLAARVSYEPAQAPPAVGSKRTRDAVVVSDESEEEDYDGFQRKKKKPAKKQLRKRARTKK